MKGHAYREAIAAVDHALTVQYARPETAHRAVGRTLALMGAQRLHAAVGFKTTAADDRQLLTLLARIENVAVRLSGIPVRVERADARRECWDAIVGDLVEVRALIAAAERPARKTRAIAARKTG